MTSLENQFLLTTSSFDLNNKFKFDNYLEIDEKYILYYDKNTVCNYIISEKKSLIFIGIFYDVNFPLKKPTEILETLFNDTNKLDDFLKGVYTFGGRWVALANIDSKMYIIPDTVSSFSTYYSIYDNNIIASSSSQILANYLNKERYTDENFKMFLTSVEFNLYENFMIGNQSIFEDIFKLLPNTYVSDESGLNRFWIDLDEDSSTDLDYIVMEVSKLLSNSIEAIINIGQKVMLPVTAGWDSRVLLATSKKFKNNIIYYVSTHNKMDHNSPDIVIPKMMSDDLNFNLQIIDDIPELSDELFEKIKLVEPLARRLSKNHIIQYHFENNKNAININGNGNEIVRLDAYDAVSRPKTVKDFLYLYSEYGHFIYPRLGLSNWRLQLNNQYPRTNLTERDFYYWEQRLGNWGSLYPKELEIAVNEISPYNNRKIVLLLSKLDKNDRSYPNYNVYRKIIQESWPELLSYPFNQLSIGSKAKMHISRRIDNEIKYKLRKFLGKR